MTTWKRLGRGSINEVWTDGSRIRRTLISDHAAVHELLNEFETKGIEGVPRLLVVEGGFEILSCLPGRAVKRPWPKEAMSLQVMAQLGEMLRVAHDATVGFEPSIDFCWRPDKRESEVVCHGDLGHWNVLLDGDRVTGLIDWDMAHCGSRLWDLTTVAIEFGPLRAIDMGAKVDTRWVEERLSAFCDSYGNVSPHELIGFAPAHLRASAAEIRMQAKCGNRLFVPLAEAQQPMTLEADADFIETKYGTM